ncbi:MAG: EcsC family protein [Candidatus Acidiferrales bacterium]
MAKNTGKAVVARRMGNALFAGFNRAYSQVQVDPKRYLERVQRAHGLPIRSFQDMFHMPEEVVDDVADQTIRASMKFAVIEGAGFGLGGFLSIVPDMGVLAAIVMRMLQKLSLVYGFEYSTDEDIARLWLAAATAAGLDLGREFVEKQAVERLVPRIIEQLAMKMGAEVAEKWTARAIPVVSGAIGGTLNYYFVREWGKRAKKHFQERHRVLRAHSLVSPPLRPRLVRGS